MIPGGAHALMLGGDPCEKYQIGHSVRFNSADSPSLSRAFGAGNRKTWTWSGWVKRTALSTDQTLFSQGSGVPSNGYGFLHFLPGNTLELHTTPDGGTPSLFWQSSAAFRDVAAHYHVVVVVDTTQAVSADRVKAYVNGVPVSGSMSTAPALNADLEFNRAAAHQIGAANASGLSNLFNGYLSDINFVDGQALTAADFGFFCLTTGQWRPKAYAGTYGTNGFHLDFSDGSAATAAALGADRSGNGNNWMPTNISVTAGAGCDWLEDTTSNNFATWNALVPGDSGKSNGALDAAGTARATIESAQIASYWEITANAVSVVGGVVSKTGTANTIAVPNGSTYGFRQSGGALDYTTDGAAWNNIADGLSGARFPYASGGANTLNAGQRTFAYTPPAGFKALCTKNLPNPWSPNPKVAYVEALATEDNIYSAIAAARSEWTDYVDILKNRGASESWAYQFSHDSANEYSVYENSVSRAAKRVMSGANNWLGKSIRIGAAYGTAAGSVTHTNGAATTVTHSIGLTARQMIFLFPRAGGSSVKVYHPDLTAGYLIDLCNNSALTEAANTSITSVTSSSFQIGSATASGTYDYLVLSEKEGLFVLGKYTGTGLTGTGAPFFYTGGLPQSFWTMSRNINYSTIYLDASRDSYNYCRNEIETNKAMAEQVVGENGYGIDIVSNGVKLLGAGNGYNATGNTYIYAMHMKQSIRYANAR